MVTPKYVLYELVILQHILCTAVSSILPNFCLTFELLTLFWPKIRANFVYSSV